MRGKIGLYAVVHADMGVRPSRGNASTTSRLSVLERHWKLKVVVIIIFSYDVLIYRCFGIQLCHCMEVYASRYRWLKKHIATNLYFNWEQSESLLNKNKLGFGVTVTSNNRISGYKG